MGASGERPLSYPTLELQIKSFLPPPAWRCPVGDREYEVGREGQTDTVLQHPSSEAEMTRMHSSSWGHLYCAHRQLQEEVNMVGQGGERRGREGVRS